jgi:putative two-component system response regulator
LKKLIDFLKENKISFEEAYKVMMESMGSHFDPQMEEVFVKSRKKLEAYYWG